ncbi:TonB-dependent heme/hemoglobin receptor family protein [Nitrosococcus halophilus Nc 4]|uniref:TonB-dependent heme/hemoglobin receptor family protein n=1 Tax=Nitrosococcus halophilus (strain Nc4) TaxID=472759 RepID=D5C334_NITHN|nr:TonB-dependent hemoglobin/transferrin/lactoferrin family receptor [Nitrosococcus halophilus]ADE14926.1 TonB-dependent heme/hemoglobin receptor family protein [Nitrosococcus halophilus Nc 4]
MIPLLCSGIGAKALADTSLDVENHVLDPVTVIATQTERPLAELPASVSVLDSEQIMRRQAQSMDDLLQVLPNIDFASGPRPIGETITIRGLSSERILTTIDGARQNFSVGHLGRFFIEPDLLKQIEVLRGSASALYGSGALGGVVAMTTREASDFLAPGERFGARLKGGYQSVNDEGSTSATLFGRAADWDFLGNFAYRDSGDLTLGSGQELDSSAAENLSGLVRLNYLPGAHQLRIGGDYFNTEGVFPANPQTVSSGTNENATTDIERRTYTLQYSYDDPAHPWLKPKLNAYRTELRDSRRRLESGRQTTSEFFTTGFKLQNSMDLAGPMAFLGQTLTFGVDYFKDEEEGRENGEPRPSFPKAESDVWGFYLQDEIALGQYLSLIPALRYDRYTLELETGQGQSTTDDALSPRIGGIFHLTSWLKLWGSYGKAFRAPTLPERLTEGLHFRGVPGRFPDNFFIPNPTLKPETVYTWETGFRSAWEGVLAAADRLNLEFTYFDTKAEDFIDLRVDILAGTTQNANLNQARLHGFEAAIHYDTSRFFARASFGRTRGEDDNTGLPLTNVQPDKGVVDLGWRFSRLGFVLGGRGRFVARQDRVPPGVLETPGYSVYDLYASWLPPSAGLKGLRVDFAIDNLTDKAYRRHLSVIEEAGRNFKVALTYQF